MITTTRIDAEIDQLTAELLTALRGYRRAKAAFAARTAHYERRHSDPVTAEFQARGDYQRQNAVADCEWYRGEVLAASAAITALTQIGGAS